MLSLGTCQAPRKREEWRLWCRAGPTGRNSANVPLQVAPFFLEDASVQGMLLPLSVNGLPCSVFPAPLKQKRCCLSLYFSAHFPTSAENAFSV